MWSKRPRPKQQQQMPEGQAGHLDLKASSGMASERGFLVFDGVLFFSTPTASLAKQNMAKSTAPTIDDRPHRVEAMRLFENGSTLPVVARHLLL